MSQSMQTAEALLPNLNRALRDLCGAVTWLNNKDLNAQLKGAMQHLWIAELLSTYWVVAIAGSQGAGKTTLARMMYAHEDGTSDLEDWLPANTGRGETMPVLLLEAEGIISPQGFIQRFHTGEGDRSAELVEEAISPEAFRKVLRGGDVNCVLPVLRVPRRYFEDDNQGFLLLPGYEARTDENRSWQTLMRRGLAGSSACVVVTDQTRLANGDQQRILRDMQSGEMAGSHPIVVVSKAEEALTDSSKSQGLIQRAGEIFDVPEDDRGVMVICSGTDLLHRDLWRQKLQQALQRVSTRSAIGRQRKAAELSAILDELSGLQFDIQQELTEAREQAEGNDTVELMLKSFDDSVRKLRARYKTGSIQMLAQHATKARSLLDKTLSSEFEGLVNKISRLTETYTEGRTRAGNAVQNAWNGAGSLNEDWLSMLEQLVRQRFAWSERKTEGEGRLPASELPQLPWLGNLDPGPGAVVWSVEFQQCVDDIRKIAAGPNGGESDEPGALSKELKFSVENLPYVVLEMTRLVSTVKCAPIPVRMEAPDTDITAAAGRVQQGFLAGMTGTQALVRGIAAMLALDAADGTIETIPALATALGFSSSAALVVTGVLTVAILTTLIMVEINRHDARVSNAAHEALSRIRDYAEAQLLDLFDSMMDELRDSLSSALIRRYRLGEQWMRRDRIERALQEVRSRKADLDSLIASRNHILALAL